MTKDDALLVKGALDSLGVVLADREHEWTDGEKEIYTQAIEILDREISWDATRKVCAKIEIMLGCLDKPVRSHNDIEDAIVIGKQALREFGGYSHD